MLSLLESRKFLTLPIISHPSCRTLSDELSRLWRLAVLSPGIPTKQRQGVIDQLRTLNQTGNIQRTCVGIYMQHQEDYMQVMGSLCHLARAYTSFHSIMCYEYFNLHLLPCRGEWYNANVRRRMVNVRLYVEARLVSVFL